MGIWCCFSWWLEALWTWAYPHLPRELGRYLKAMVGICWFRRVGWTLQGPPLEDIGRFRISERAFFERPFDAYGCDSVGCEIHLSDSNPRSTTPPWRASADLGPFGRTGDADAARYFSSESLSSGFGVKTAGRTFPYKLTACWLYCYELRRHLKSGWLNHPKLNGV